MTVKSLIVVLRLTSFGKVKHVGTIHSPMDSCVISASGCWRVPKKHLLFIEYYYVLIWLRKTLFHLRMCYTIFDSHLGYIFHSSIRRSLQYNRTKKDDGDIASDEGCRRG
jgi:hypothetical protein